MAEHKENIFGGYIELKEENVIVEVGLNKSELI
jgi:hypothetical protein